MGWLCKAGRTTYDQPHHRPCVAPIWPNWFTPGGSERSAPAGRSGEYSRPSWLRTRSGTCLRSPRCSTKVGARLRSDLRPGRGLDRHEPRTSTTSLPCAGGHEEPQCPSGNPPCDSMEFRLVPMRIGWSAAACLGAKNAPRSTTAQAASANRVCFIKWMPPEGRATICDDARLLQAALSGLCRRFGQSVIGSITTGSITSTPGRSAISLSADCSSKGNVL